MKTDRRWMVVGLVVAVVAVVGSCGDDDTSSMAGGPTTSTSAAETTTEPVEATTESSDPVIDITFPEPSTTKPSSTGSSPGGDLSSEDVAVDVGALSVPDGYSVSQDVSEVLDVLELEGFPHIVDDDAELVSASRSFDETEGREQSGLIYQVVVSGDHLDILEPIQQEFENLGSGHDDSWITDIVPDDDGHVLRITAPPSGEQPGPHTYQVRVSATNADLVVGDVYQVSILGNRPATSPQPPGFVANELGSAISLAEGEGYESTGWEYFTFVEPAEGDIVETEELVYQFDASGTDAEEFAAAIDADADDVERVEPSPVEGAEAHLRTSEVVWVLFDDGRGEAVGRYEYTQ